MMYFEQVGVYALQWYEVGLLKHPWICLKFLLHTRVSDENPFLHTFSFFFRGITELYVAFNILLKNYWLEHKNLEIQNFYVTFF